MIVGSQTGKRGTINIGNTAGGVNWPGSSFDPETHIVYIEAANANVTSGSLRTSPPGFSDIRYVAAMDGTEFRVAEGPGFGSAADAPQRGGGGRGGPGAAPSGAGAGGGRGAGGGAATPRQRLAAQRLRPPVAVASVAWARVCRWGMHERRPFCPGNFPAKIGMDGTGGSI